MEQTELKQLIAYLRTDKHEGSEIEFNRQLDVIKRIYPNDIILCMFKEVADGYYDGRDELARALIFQNKKENKESLLVCTTMEVLTQNLTFACRLIDEKGFILCEARGVPANEGDFIYHLLAVMAQARRLNIDSIY